MVAGPLDLLLVSRFSWTWGMCMGCSSKRYEVALLIDSSILRGWCGWLAQSVLSSNLKFGGPRFKEYEPLHVCILTWSVTSLYYCHIISGFTIQQNYYLQEKTRRVSYAKVYITLLYHPPDHPLCSLRTSSLYSSYKLWDLLTLFYLVLGCREMWCGSKFSYITSWDDGQPLQHSCACCKTPSFAVWGSRPGE